MYTLETGLFPLAAIVVGALLTLIFFSVVRLKCSARWAIGFIFAAMAMITICSVVTPVRWVELEGREAPLLSPLEGKTNGGASSPQEGDTNVLWSNEAPLSSPLEGNT